MKATLCRSIFVASTLAFSTLASAAVITFTTWVAQGPGVLGSNKDDWNQANNWSGSAVPNSTSVAEFSGTTARQNVKFNPGDNAYGIQIDAGAQSFNFQPGSNFVTLYGGGILNNATTNQSGLAVTLGAAAAFTNNGGTLTIGNTNTNGFGLTLNGTGTAGAMVQVISGSGSLTKSGTGTWAVNGANTFSGGTTVSSGTMTLGNAAALGNVTGGVTVNGGTLNIAALALTARTGIVSLQSGSIIGTTGILSKTGGTFDLQSGTVGAILGGTAGLDKTTSGTVTLSAANTYTGATTVSDGTLSLNTGAGINAIAAASALSITSAGIVQLNAINQLTNVNLTLDSGGKLALNGTLNTLSFGTLNVGAGGGVLDFGPGGNSTVYFADSSAITWGGGTLQVINYVLGVSHLYFGTNNSALTSTQLALMDFSSSFSAPPGTFLGEFTGANIGEVVPEPSTYAALFGVAALSLALYRRRRLSAAASN